MSQKGQRIPQAPAAIRKARAVFHDDETPPPPSSSFSCDRIAFTVVYKHGGVQRTIYRLL